jgi:predicted Zn-dependent protease
MAMRMRPPLQPTVILHLSDIHFGDARNQKEEDSKTLVLQSLKLSLTRIDIAWKPQAVCITGDIAFRGARPDYARAAEWITEILKLLELPVEALFLSAGNHDIDRKKAKPPTFTGTGNESDQLFNLPLNQADPIFDGFAEYVEFCETLGHRPYKCGKVESHLVGQREFRGINFVTSNSSWFSRDSDTDKGKLWMGLPLLKHMAVNDQINQLADQATNLFDVSVGLMHHPQEWFHHEELHPGSSGRAMAFHFLALRLELLLTGHTHDAATVEPHLLYGKCVHLGGGAVYENDQYRNNFRLIRIQPGDPPKFDSLAYEYDPHGTGWRPYATRLAGALQLRRLFQSLPVESEFIEPDETAQALPNAASPVTQQPDLESTEWDPRIKQGVQMMQDRKLDSAESYYESLYLDATAGGASANDQARILNNLAVIQIQKGKAVKALELLNRVRLLPGHKLESTVLTNMAQALLMQNLPDDAVRAAEEAFNLNPADPHVLSTYSKTLLITGKQQQIASLIPTVNDDAPADMVASIGQMELDAGLIDSAIEHLSAALISGVTQKDQVRDALAVALLRAAYQELKEAITTTGEADTSSLRKLIDAETLLTDLLRETAEAEHQPPRKQLFRHRGEARLLLGRWQDALNDFDAVLGFDSRDRLATKNKANCLYVLGEKREALNLLRPIADDEQSKLVLSQLLLDIDLPQEASELTISIRPTNAFKCRLLWHVARATNEQERARDLAKQAEAFPDDWDAIEIVAQQKYDDGEPDEAVELLENAVGRFKGRFRGSATVNLARLLNTLDRSKEAAHWLLTLEQQDESMSEFLAAAYYHAGLRQRAWQILHKSTEGWSDREENLRIKEKLYEDIGAFEDASMLSNRLISLYPTAENLLSLARVCMIKGDEESAIAIAHRLRDSISKLSARQIVYVSSLYRLLAFVVAPLDMLYRARQQFFNEPEIHIAYVTLYKSLTKQQMKQFAQTFVGPDCAVRLRDHGGERTVILTDDERRKPSLEHSEISLRSELAQLLLGKQVGDSLTISTGNHSEIVAVMHKFDFALIETLENFRNWFPAEEGVIVTPRATPEPITNAIVESQYQRKDDVAELETQGFSAGKMAEHFGESYTTSWLKYYASGGVAIFGDEISQRPIVGFEAESECVFDLSAVLMLYVAGLLDLSLKEFRVSIPASYLEEIQSAREEQLLVDGSIRYQDPSIVIVPLNRDERGQLIQSLRNSLTNGPSSLLPVPQLITEEHSQLCNDLGDLSAAAFLLASDKNCTIVTDDSVVRSVVTQNGISAISSAQLLNVLSQRNLIDARTYATAKVRLALSGYKAQFLGYAELVVSWYLYRNAARTLFERLVALTLSQDDPIASTIAVTRLCAFLWQRNHTVIAFEAVATMVHMLGPDVMPRIEALLFGFLCGEDQSYLQLVRSARRVAINEQQSTN